MLLKSSHKILFKIDSCKVKGVTHVELTHSHIQLHTHTYNYSHTYIQTNTYIQLFTHIHTNKHIHTITHTHTHTDMMYVEHLLILNVTSLFCILKRKRSNYKIYLDYSPAMKIVMKSELIYTDLCDLLIYVIFFGPDRFGGVTGFFLFLQ